MSQRESTTPTGNGFRANRSDSHSGGSNMMLPPPLGFHRSRALSTTFSAELYSLGYAVSRVSIDNKFVTILIGLNDMSIRSGQYIRTLLVNVRENDEKSKPVAGILLEGDPIQTKIKALFGLRPKSMDDGMLKNYQFCELISQTVYKGLSLYASADGCVVNAKKALSFFSDGHVDHVVRRALCAPSLDAAIQGVIVYDETFDLNYQVALGINDDAEYSADQLDTISLVSRLHKAGLVDNPTSFDQMASAFGLNPASLEEGFHGPIDLGPVQVNFEYIGLSYKESPRFSYARSREFHDPVLWLPNGYAISALYYFRPGLHGFDIGGHNRLNKHRFRSHGVIVIAPVRLRFLDLAENQAMAWNIFIAEAVKYYDVIHRNNHMHALGT